MRTYLGQVAIHWDIDSGYQTQTERSTLKRRTAGQTDGHSNQHRSKIEASHGYVHAPAKHACAFPSRRLRDRLHARSTLAKVGFLAGLHAISLTHSPYALFCVALPFTLIREACTRELLRTYLCEVAIHWENSQIKLKLSEEHTKTAYDCSSIDEASRGYAHAPEKHACAIDCTLTKVGFLACLHALSLERSRFRENAQFKSQSLCCQISG